MLLSLLAGQEPAWAIPAFARDYGVSCSSCHVSITRRNEFGDAFRKAGYHWPGAAERELAQGGDDEITGLGASLFATVLPAQLPVAISATFSGAYTTDPEAQARFVAGAPALNILLGGRIGPNVGFFGTWAGQGAPNELYLHITEPFSTPALNFRLGLFEQTTTLFKSNESLVAPYLLGASSLEGHAVSQGRLGAEANGVVGGRSFWAVGTVQNGGLGSAMDGYYHLGHRLGGTDFRGEDPEIDLDAESILDDLTVTLGHWGYLGSVHHANDDLRSRIKRLGLDAQVRYRRLTVWGGAMLGLDHNFDAGRRNTSLTAFGEVAFAVTSWLTPIYVFQYQDAASLPQARRQHDLGVVVLLLEDIRARARFSYSDDGVNNESADIQVLVAF